MSDIICAFGYLLGFSVITVRIILMNLYLSHAKAMFIYFSAIKVGSASNSLIYVQQNVYVTKYV